MKRVLFIVVTSFMLSGCEFGCLSAEQITDPDTKYDPPVVEKVD